MKEMAFLNLHSYMANTSLGFIGQTKRKSYGCEAEIDYMLVGEKYRKSLAVIDLDKKVLKKIVRKQRIIKRKIWKLNENRTRVRFKRVKS